MASSSNSKRPSSSSSSSNSKWRYDVFLSFRGEDTRNNFTGHLYRALDHANIETFKDDKKLPRGEEIAPELLKAIEGSRIALIVFSKNYADSKWCLDELVKIMECEKEKGQKVFPIFYHVEPSEVRKQSGIYGEAFNNHERNADEEKKKKIEQWRTALTKAGGLSGFPLEDRSEAEFIEEIIGEIRRLIPKWVHVGENIVGMDEKLKEVKLLIDAQSNKVSMVGIYGIGGIGKTTIAKVVYNDMLDQFKCHSFLENVREKYEDKDGLLELQKKLLCDILMEKDLKLSNTGEGFEKIKSKRHSEKVLIVLDDVGCEGQLEFLAPNSDCFHRGSIIIVTTRNKRCLDVYDSYSSYEAKGLAHEQAKELFCGKAFKQDHPIENYVDLSNGILDYAKGLPLALVVLGSFLFGRDVDVWESTLDELKTIPLEHIQKVLQISYDGLSDERKKLFLYIACFFKDEDEKMATRILESCKLHPAIGLRVLHERCLISIEDNTIRMHDLLQEMGWAIVCNDPQRPGKWSRLCELQDIESVLRQSEWTENIDGIFTSQSRHTGKHIQVTTEVFRKMNQLRLLKVEFNEIVQLSQDFELPCHDLVYFHWDDYPLESLPSNFHADNLVQLNLQDSKIKHFWEGNMPAKKLKVIDLSHSSHLVDISSISSMPNLETLILTGCESLESLPRNLHELKCLQTLSCDDCSNLESFPEIKEEMRSLRKLNLSATDIWKLPSSIRHLNGLEDLDLSYCQNLLSLPNSICSLSSLQALNLYRCSELKSLPRNLHKLECLQTLSCADCSNLKRFPEIEKEMRSLRELSLSATDIRKLPSSIRHLNGLEDLDLSYCENLLSLPDSICSLSSLQALNLYRCSKLKSLPRNLHKLECLQILFCADCSNLKSFPEIEKEMRSLRALSLSDTGITELPSSIRHLNGLEGLNLSYCHNLLSLPDSICSLSSLQALNLYRCSKLKSLPRNLHKLKCLQTLSCDGCSNLEGFPEIKEEMRSLRKLCLSARGITELPSSIRHLNGLEELGLIFCPNLLSLSDSIYSLSSLQALDLSRCSELESLPRNLHKLKCLQTLSCSGCSNLESFPEIEEEMRSLRKLRLSATGITELPSSIRHLNGLEDLDLSSCKNLLSLPDSINSLSSLQTLLLRECSKLKSFPDINIGSLKALKDLDLSLCKNLESLPNSIGSLSSLQTLLLEKCSKLKSFLDINIGSLKALKDLDLSLCENLESLPESIYNLSSLKTLKIRNCRKLKEMLQVTLGVYPMPWLHSSLTCHISNSVIIWDDHCFSSLEALNPRCLRSSSLVDLSVRKFYGMEEDILSGSFHLSSLEILSLGSFPRVVEGILDGIFHLSSLVELSLTKCKPKEEGLPSDIWNLSPLQKLCLRDCNLMEGKILNHICHLTSLKVLYLGWNHFSSIPAGISRLSNLEVLNLSHCKNLQQIPELPSSLRFLDAHCSDGISSSRSLLPIHSMVNCFKSFNCFKSRSQGFLGAFVQRSEVIDSYPSFSGNGISIVIPRSSGILEWLTYQNMGRHEVTIELPRNWYKNDDLWGFALYCVSVAPADESQDVEGGFSCELTIKGNNQTYFFFLSSDCFKYDVSDMQWVIYYPKLDIEKCYHTNQWRHFEVSFYHFISGVDVKVKECGIRLVYREDYEQKHPTMAQGSTSHGNFGEHGSVREDTNSKAHNKRNPTEQSPGDESHHKRFRETQD